MGGLLVALLVGVVTVGVMLWLWWEFRSKEDG